MIPLHGSSPKLYGGVYGQAFLISSLDPYYVPLQNKSDWLPNYTKPYSVFVSYWTRQMETEFPLATNSNGLSIPAYTRFSFNYLGFENQYGQHVLVGYLFNPTTNVYYYTVNQVPLLFTASQLKQMVGATNFAEIVKARLYGSGFILYSE